MARGPFQGTFQPNLRPTVVSAPDALVYINGELEVIGCPQCTKVFDLNKYITSIQVDLGINQVPGSASVSLSVPRHIVDDFFFDGNPVITPMMEIEIYAKGYYLLEGMPQYYPIFWGLVTEVNDSYSSGEHSFTIQCADILKWWELCKMSITSAWTAPQGQLGRNIFNNVFFGTNPYDIIWSLALQSFGDVVVGANSLTTEVQEKGTRANASLPDLMLYWQKRFSRIRSNLLLYGTTGATVRGDSLFQHYSAGRGRKRRVGKNWASSAIANANGGVDGGQAHYDPSNPKIQSFRTNFSAAGPPDLWQSEFQSKLEIATAAKESIGFEFFMDVTGDIVFKPPFYNLDIFSNKPVSWIQDIDIIDWDFGESESEVITQLIMQGSYGGNVDYGFGEETTPMATVVDYALLRKYGWRSQDYNSEYLGNTHMMFFHGLDMLDRINSRRHRGSVTIPFRPELRLGFPVYIAPKDQIWYVEGISHNITFGGRAQTQLTLTAKRSKFVAPRGTATLTLDSVGSDDSTRSNEGNAFPVSTRTLSRKGNFTLNVEDAASIPGSDAAYAETIGSNNPYEPLILRHPKTGRLVGYPNVVMVYTRPFTPNDLAAAEQLAGKKRRGKTGKLSRRAQKRIQENVEADSDTLLRFTRTDDDALRDKFGANRYQYGLNSAGVFVYAHDVGRRGSKTGGVIGEAFAINKDLITVVPDQELQGSKIAKTKVPTALIRPVSDERGFEVVGHYRYGRKVALRDVRLVLNSDTAKTKVDLQLALSGDVFSTLTAQSQGLTAGRFGENPATVLSELRPDEEQTAGVLDQNTQEPVFTEAGDDYISAGKLSDPEVRGTGITVEATALSRALTLTEMGVKVGKDRQADCPCVLGRSDLSFMAVGYNVKVLRGSSVDESLITDGNDVDLSVPIQSGRGQSLGSTQTALQQRIEQLQRQLGIAITQLNNVEKPKNQKGRNAYKRAQQRVTDIENQLNATEQSLAATDAQIGELERTRQVEGGGILPTGSPTAAADRVDEFLTNLYKALDKPHQELEAALRGDLIPKRAGDDVANIRFGDPAPQSEFAPPFNAPNRFRLGDGPAARVADIKSNAEGLAKAWSDFGSNLKSNSERARLTTEITNATASITRLNSSKAELEQQLATEAVVIGVDLQSEIERVDTQIAELEQSRANDRLKLQQLNNENN